MASMESFYGGRQGASFVIVKRFDGINIPDNTPKIKTVAVTSDEKYYLYDNGFIEKNGNNCNNYVWGYLTLDGSTVDTVTAEGSTTIVPITTTVEYQEGMLQCFRKAGDSTNEVNYGEYVIIDTITGRGEYTNPDNGKVFRRGINNETDLAGAEYIGQIVGPQGECPELEFDHYKSVVGTYTKVDDPSGNPQAQGWYEYKADVDNYILTEDTEVVSEKDYFTYTETIPADYKYKEYTNATEDLVPGYYLDGDTPVYNDEIKYVYRTLKDANGNVKGCVIGFKLPTLVMDFESESVSPYFDEELIIPTDDTTIYNPIEKKWEHPFYQKWKVRIPKGIHGDDLKNLEVIHTKTHVGIQLYTKSGDIFIPTGIQTTEALSVITDAYEQDFPQGTDIYNENGDYVAVNYNIGYYARKQDCYMDVIRYKEINYDEDPATWIYHLLGDYNTIEKITLSEYGILSVYYTSKADPEQINQPIRWIDNTGDTEGISIDTDGTVRIYYNTLDNNNQHEKIVFDRQLIWIKSIDLNSTVDDPNCGKLKIEFNNGNIRGGDIVNGVLNKTLKWIDKIVLEEDGTVNFYYCNDHTNPIYTATKYLKKIDDIQIETIAEGETYEGTGDQRVHVTYNTSDTPEAIGLPLNYIIETAVTPSNYQYTKNGETINIGNHLLIYYSDPALRTTLQDKWVEYPSSKYPSQTWTEWIDMGSIKGDDSTIHFLIDIPNDPAIINQRLKDGSGNWIPPEQILDPNTGLPINPNAVGWAITISDGVEPNKVSEISIFDYEDREWKGIGTIDSSLIDPKYVIVKSLANAEQMPNSEDVSSLRANGIWLAQETVYFAE